jgi:hypothetical protein
MIDQAYQSEINKNLDDQQFRTEGAPPPKLSVFAGFDQAFGGIPGGAARGIGSTFDILQGAALVDASQGMVYNPGTRSYTRLPMDDSSRALQKTIESGRIADLFTSDTGDTFRTVAKDYMPDPMSTGRATQIVGNSLAFMTQAVPAMSAGGPFMGPAMVGTMAGMQQADDLHDQGVDQRTRMVVGAVGGAGAAASMVLPMTGATRWVAAGRGAAGGAALSVAQTQAEKLILSAHGYDGIASTYDPFDPVSLTLNSLVPAAFAGALWRAAPTAPYVEPPLLAPRSLHDVVRSMESDGQRFGADGTLLTSPKGAQGEMQVMPATARDPGFGVKPAADDSPAELARVGHDYLNALYQRYNGDLQKTLAAYNDGPGNVDRAVAEKPDNWLSLLPAETQAYAIHGARSEVLGRFAPVNSESVRAARVIQTADALDSSRLTPDDDMAGHEQHQRAVETASDQIARGAPVEVGDIVIEQPIRAADVQPFDPAFLHDDTNVNPEARAYTINTVDAVSQALDLVGPERLEQIASDRVLANAQPDSAWHAEHAAQIEMAARKVVDFYDRQPDIHERIQQARPLQVAKAVDEYRAAQAPEAAPIKPNHAAFHEARAEAEAAAGERKVEAPKGSREASALTTKAPAALEGQADHPGPAAEHLDAAVAQVLRDTPDLMIHVDGMSEPMLASDWLASVREQAAETVRDSQLLMAAAQCAIS